MNYSDIKLEIDDICDSTDTSFPVATKLRRVNTALEETVGEIIGVSGDFQFDDSNFTTLPIGMATLVASQQQYSFDATFLDILGVSVKDSSGNYQALVPIDQRDMGQGIGNSSGSLNRTGKLDPSEFESTPGMPVYYDKTANGVMLYPAPASGSVTLSAGLKVFFQRTSSPFVLGDTTKEPGFMSTYHRIIPLRASLPYCRKYKPSYVPSILAEIKELREGLLERYARRPKDEPTRLRIMQESNR